jgi:DNA-binding CsgD family transcriptional regulator
MLAAARGDLAGALQAVENGLEYESTSPHAFERGRLLLVRGTVHRRERRKGAAAEALSAALEIFEELGAALWAGRAHSELAHLGGRPAQDGRLSETERQIAELVAQGRSNAETARALSVSSKTVEWNLSKIYKKLGVRSRTELAAKLGRKG